MRSRSWPWQPHLVAGIALPYGWTRVLLAIGCFWVLASVVVLLALIDWDGSSSRQQRRLVIAAHWCGLVPFLLIAGAITAAFSDALRYIIKKNDRYVSEVDHLPASWMLLDSSD